MTKANLGFVKSAYGSAKGFSVIDDNDVRIGNSLSPERPVNQRGVRAGTWGTAR